MNVQEAPTPTAEKTAPELVHWVCGVNHDVALCGKRTWSAFSEIFTGPDPVDCVVCAELHEASFEAARCPVCGGECW